MHFEERAIVGLEQYGYQILANNYRCPRGEIDVIAMHQGYLVFIEVKYRTNDSCGDVWAAVNYQKQRRISAVATWYMMKNRLREDTKCRFDVVGVTPAGIQVCQNAFNYIG